MTESTQSVAMQSGGHYCPIYLMSFGSGIYSYYAEHCTTHAPHMICSPNPLSPLGCTGNPTSPPCVPASNGYMAATTNAPATPFVAHGVSVWDGCGRAFAEACGHPFASGWPHVLSLIEATHVDCSWLPKDSQQPMYFRLFKIVAPSNHEPGQDVVMRVGVQLNLLKHPDKSIRPAEAVEQHGCPANVAIVTFGGRSYTTFLM